MRSWGIPPSLGAGCIHEHLRLLVGTKYKRGKDAEGAHGSLVVQVLTRYRESLLGLQEPGEHGPGQRSAQRSRTAALTAPPLSLRREHSPH